MTEDRPDRQNPARDAERVCIAIVRKWVGDRGVVVDLSGGHGPDFRVDYADGRIALGEIGLDADPVYQQMWAATLSTAENQVIELPVGLGQWSLGLELGADIRGLKMHLPNLLADLHARGARSLSVTGPWPRTAEADVMRSTGIKYLSRASDDEPSCAVVLMPPSSGVVPHDLDAIADWIEHSMLKEYPDSWRKLADLEADERHVCFMAGSRTPIGVAMLLERRWERAPSRPLKVPKIVTHAWGVAGFGHEGAAMWSRRGDWIQLG